MTSITQTREELHRLVWEMPMYRLAAQHGITGNGLAKVYDRLSIPYPPRGFWARKAAGKKVMITPLPPGSKGTPQMARITPTLKREAVAPDPGIVERVARLQKEIETSARGRSARRHPIITAWVEERKLLSGNRAEANRLSVIRNQDLATWRFQQGVGGERQETSHRSPA